jgi:hypothetical protein
MRPLESKNAITIILVRLACTLALTGPGSPFFSHCFDCCFVSGVWKDTIDSSIVTILSNMALEWRRTIDKNASHVLTLSCFCLLSNSRGTHLADFLTNPSSWCKMEWMVLTDVLWTIESFLMVIRRSSCTVAATSATRAGLLTFFCIRMPLVNSLLTSLNFV